jgi:hypothetical protein
MTGMPFELLDIRAMVMPGLLHRQGPFRFRRNNHGAENAPALVQRPVQFVAVHGTAPFNEIIAGIHWIPKAAEIRSTPLQYAF